MQITDPTILVNYIKQSVEILLNMKEEEIEFINREKQTEILKLKTKLKKITNTKWGTASKSSSQPKQLLDQSPNDSKNSLLKTFLFDLPPEYEDMI